MADYHVLSESDKRVLQNILDKLKNLPVPRVPPQALEDDIQAPDVYLALTPEGGIDATDEGVFGSAFCKVYQASFEESEASPVDTGKTQEVFNFSEVAIPQNTYVLILRDKWGTWFVLSALSSSDSGGSGRYAYLVLAAIDDDWVFVEATIGGQTWAVSALAYLE